MSTGSVHGSCPCSHNTCIDRVFQIPLEDMESVGILHFQNDNGRVNEVKSQPGLSGKELYLLEEEMYYSPKELQ